MKTFQANNQTISRQWLLIDAKDVVLGRLASAVAHRLRGKHKAEYTPHVDTGDYIVIVNADKIKVTGAKRTDKQYYRYTGYPGGIKSTSFDKLIAKNPELIVEKSGEGHVAKEQIRS